MIIAWLLSLLVLLSSLLVCLERLSAIEIIGANSAVESGRRWIASEKVLMDCEKNLSQITAIENVACHIRSVGKNLWLISSIEKPHLEILVHLDEKTNAISRLNWRQQFE